MSALERSAPPSVIPVAAEAPETGEPSEKSSKHCSCDAFLKTMLVTNVAATALTTVSAAMASAGGSGMTAVFLALGGGAASVAAQIGQVVALKKLGLKCCSCASSWYGGLFRALLATNVAVAALSTATAATAAGGGAGLTIVYVAFGAGAASLTVQLVEVIVLRKLGVI